MLIPLGNSFHDRDMREKKTLSSMQELPGQTQRPLHQWPTTVAVPRLSPIVPLAASRQSVPQSTGVVRAMDNRRIYIPSSSAIQRAQRLDIEAYHASLACCATRSSVAGSVFLSLFDLRRNVSVPSPRYSRCHGRCSPSGNQQIR